MNTSLADQPRRTPLFPRRAIWASVISVLLASGFVVLIILGNLTAPVPHSFQFSRATNLAVGEDQRLRAVLSDVVADDRLWVTVVGHSGTIGDAQANTDLSTARADTVRDLALQLGIRTGQINAIGVGGARPLPQSDGESERAYQSRLARVDVTVQLRR
ncbi:MAG: OmpA family protein [Pseudomonadota bacterium]